MRKRAKSSAAPLSAVEAQWAKRVARLERSGLSIRRFAVREGLKAGSLSFWKWKLAQRQGRRSEPQRVAPLRFVELTTNAAAATVPARFEVVLAGGRVVRVPGGFDAPELARLLGLLLRIDLPFVLLIPADWNTAEGLKRIQEESLVKNRCPAFVRDAASILEALLLDSRSPRAEVSTCCGR